MINIKNLYPNKIKIDKSYKNILINYIGYVTVKNLNYAKIITVNFLCLINKIMGTLKKIMEINIVN